MNEEQKVGIEEIKAVVVAINEIAILIGVRAKDGLGVDDAAAIVNKVISDADFRGKMEAAVAAIHAVPDEVKDLDLAEIYQLVGVEVGYIPKLIEAFKKDAPVAG